MQNLLLIQNSNVVVQSQEKTYDDTYENFLLDGGTKLPEGVNSIDYNKAVQSCWINGEAFKGFPNEYAEAVLASIGELILNRENRNAPPEPSLDELKASKLEALNSAHVKAEEDAHVTSSLGFKIDANDRANRDLNGLIQTLGESKTMFCDYHNQFHKIGVDECKTMLGEIIANAQSLYAQKWALRQAINAAESKEALNAVEIAFTYMDFTPKDAE